MSILGVLARSRAHVVPFFILVSFLSHASDGRRYNYTPDHLSRPYSESVQIQGTWDNSIRFLENRGPHETSFLKEVLALLSPTSIKKIKGYKNPGSTRITLMTYEVRSREVVQAVAQLLEAGYNVRIVSDPGTYTLIKKPTAAEWKNWTPEQRNYFLGNYDTIRDAKITPEEILQANKKHHLAFRIWKKLQDIRKAYPEQLELISPPYEIVPQDARYPYPRLTHVKRYTIDFKKPDGSWATQVALIGSANLTDTCLNQRVSGSPENIKAYVEGEKNVQYVKGSQGHVQFGAVFYGEKLNAPLAQVPDQWIDLYKKGKHFDDLAPGAAFLPRVVFTDANKNVTSVQAFFSEGIKPPPPGVSNVDPVMAVTSILGRPDIELKVMFSSQFVVTHSALSRHLRHHLAHGGLEDFGLFVDGNFATEPYSAIPEMLFAPKIDNRLGTMPGRSIQTLRPLAQDFDYLGNTFVYEGDRGVVGEPGDKLHTKSAYYEYLDGSGTRHYLVVFGSANQSNNAGRQNADGLIVIDSTDASLSASVRPFFESLKKDARMRPFGEAYLERRFLEMFQQNEEILTPDVLQDWVSYLNYPPSTKRSQQATLKRLVAKLEFLEPINEQGTRFLKGLQWFVKQKHMPFQWENFQLLLFLSTPENVLQPGLMDDVRSKWLPEDAKPAEKAALTNLLKNFVQKAKRLKLTDGSRSSHYVACVKHLVGGYYKRLGISVPTEKGKLNAY